MTEPPNSTAIKTEQRLWSIVVAVCLGLGGWWLQNQYQTLLHIQEQVTEQQRFVEEHYVDRDLYGETNRAVDRRLDKLEAAMREVERRIPPLAK